MSGRVFISVIPSRLGLTVILRNGAGRGVYVTPLHLEDAQCQGDAAAPVAPQIAMGRGAGQRANERAIISACPFSVARFFRGSSSSAQRAGAVARTLVARLDMVERIASPVPRRPASRVEQARSEPGALRKRPAVGSGNRHRHKRQLETDPRIKADGIATPTV